MPIKENILLYYIMQVLTIEEIEKEVKRLFGNNDLNMPILLVPPSNTKRKIVIKHKKLTTSIPKYSTKLGK